MIMYMTFLEFYEDTRKKNNNNPYKLSDKGGESHSYIEKFYDKEFSNIRYNNITLVEIGVWRGKSLELFDDWFVNGEIIGIDNIKPDNEYHFFNDVIFEMKNRNVKLILGDGYDKKIVNSFEDESIDYLIDDACHDINKQIECVELYYPKIKRGGKIIIEDISNLDENLERFRNMKMNMDVYDMRWNLDKTIAPHLYNNVLVVFEKK